MKTKELFELHYLSQKFYEKYNAAVYPKIEHKPQRPYIMLLIKIDENTFALPLRTNIRHNSCYKFRHSSRPTESVTGIDFSKAVIINDKTYIDGIAEIDNKEYVELNDRIVFIMSKFRTYLKGYYVFAMGKAHEQQAKRYRYTTLKYFHKELGIKD